MMVSTTSVERLKAMSCAPSGVTPTARGAATDSGPPGQHIHSGPPAFRGGGRGAGGMGGEGVWLGIPRDIPLGRNRDCVPEPVFFSPSPKSDYTVSAIKIIQFCM